MDNNKQKVLVLGSEGLVGNSIKRSKSLNNKYNIHYSNRLEANLIFLKEVETLFNNVDPDFVINCAGKVGGIIANSTEKYDFLTQNLRINLNIFETIKNMNEVTLINLGSSAIYPKDSKVPIKESELMTGKLEQSNSSYSLAKIVGIELGRSLSNQSISCINMIPTNLYGPSDNFNPISSHVVPGLISKINNAKLEKRNEYMVWGSGNPLRELLYVDDLVNALEIVLKSSCDFDMVNVGSGIEVSIKELALKIKDLVGFEGDIVFDTTKPDGIERKALDSSLIRSLGWKPSTTLDQGLNYTYKWFLQNKN